MTRILLFLSFVFLSTASAVAWAQQPAQAGPSAKDLFEMGMNALTGTGVSRSDVNALKYFHSSADLGYAPAQDVMGYFAQTGSVTPQDEQSAVSWYEKAAQQGDRLGEWSLGSLYYSRRDLHEAERWLRLAADQGDAFGQYLLGLVKRDGGDYAEAADLFRKAANQGLPQAQKQLGLLLKQGPGKVTVDKAEAYIWLYLAFQAGNQTVADDLQRLESDLGSKQTEQTKTKARERQNSVARTVVARGCTGWPGEFSDTPTPPPPDLQRFCR